MHDIIMRLILLIVRSPMRARKAILRVNTCGAKYSHASILLTHYIYQQMPRRPIIAKHFAHEKATD